jgi:hypothetical protein
MYSSTYLSWFRRLLILGAVVAGLTASAAGARLDPGDGASAVSANQASFVSRPPDVSDAASAVSANQASLVSRPPDVQDAANSVSAVYPDVFERYAAAHPYGTGLSSGTTPVDRIIAQEQGRQLDLGLFSLGFSAPSTSGEISTPPDVQDVMTALHSTPVGIAPTWEHQLHSPGTVPASGGSEFAWDDWAIGVGAGLGLALLLGIGLMVGRQQRGRMQPA